MFHPKTVGLLSPFVLKRYEIASYESKHDITPNYDKLWNVQGYYNDNEGNDIRCRD